MLPAPSPAPTIHPDAHRLQVAYRTHLRDILGVTRRYRDNTITTCDRFFRILGPTRSPKQATPADYRTFLDGLAPSTQGCYGRIILAAYRWAHEERLISSNPLRRVRAPKVHIGPPRDLTIEQVRRVIDALADDPRILIGALIQYGAGPRRKEITEARVERCYLGHVNPWIEVTGKGGKVRRIPLDAPGLADALRTWVGERTHGPIIQSLRDPGQPISPNHYSKVMRRLLLAAGLGGVTSHQLRHTCATVLMRRGVLLEVIRDLLGHASVQTTERYVSGWNPNLHDAASKHPMLGVPGHPVVTTGRVAQPDQTRPRVGRPANNVPASRAVQPGLVVAYRVTHRGRPRHRKRR